MKAGEFKTNYRNNSSDCITGANNMEVHKCSCFGLRRHLYFANKHDTLHIW